MKKYRTRFYLNSEISLILLFLFCFGKIEVWCDLININIDLQYPVSFTLLNGNIIVFSTKGFFTFDSEFSLLSNYSFLEELNIDLSKNNNYPSFSQYSKEEEEFVLCIILGNIYFFNNNGKILNIYYIGDDLINDEYSSNFLYNIIPYKVEDSNYYFFVFYIYFNFISWEGGQLNILY